jgi:hypothetical protein
LPSSRRPMTAISMTLCRKLLLDIQELAAELPVQ